MTRFPAYRVEEVSEMPFARFLSMWWSAGLPNWLDLADDPAPDSIIDIHQARLRKAARLKAQFEAERAGS